MWKALVLMACLAPEAKAAPVRDLAVPLVAVAGYDQARLVGQWYEVAQTPTFLEQNCHATTAEVATRDDSRLTVKIACHKGTVAGPVLPLEGVLAQTDPGVFQLRFVRLAEFDNLALAVLWQAPDDSIAVLGSPLGDVGWIWSKTAHPDVQRLEDAKAALIAAGYRAKAIKLVEQAP